MTMVGGKTVFVGLSGGVDSAVSAARLQRAGYNVVGVFIKVWHPDFLVCNWEAERLDAMRVAAHLGIPFLTCDAEARYRDEVAGYFIAEYQAGRTPNPDVLCNKYVKFGAFLEFAKQHGADYIATGHYAQNIEADGVASLHRGADTEKDQSYFLWSLTREQLAQALFPIGDTAKADIRKEAAHFKLPVFDKKDSQGICFLGHVDIKDFLSHYVTLTPGAVLDEAGVTVGEHEGALVYTIGQRHGFTLKTAGTTTAPHYVIAKNIENNSITVSSRRPVRESKARLTITETVMRGALAVGHVVEAQTRYRQVPFLVRVSAQTEDTLELESQAAHEATAVGQSCVLYRGAECLGGGIIS